MLRVIVLGLLVLVACDSEIVDACPVSDAITACEATACWFEGTVLHCDASWSLPDGHRGDFAIGTPSNQPWNELPYNADAGAWENADYRGGDSSACGHVSIDTALIQPHGGERSVLLICDDMTMHQFEVHRIRLTDAGPLIEQQ